MASTTMLVLVQYDFHYTAKDGRLVSIKPNESYILVCKTNEHWWRVRRDQCSRPFYVPAQYVKEMPGDNTTAATPRPSPQGALGEDFGFCGDVPETEKPEQSSSSSSSSSAQIMDRECGSGSLLNSQQADSSDLYVKPVPRYRKQSQSLTQDHYSKHDDDRDFPEPPRLPPCLPPLDPAPEENFPDVGEQFEPGFRREARRRAADGGSSAEAPTDQVQLSRCENISTDVSRAPQCCDLKR